MKIHFCDLCNESVPEADFSTGKAFLRHGRVVCASCESSMTVGSAPTRTTLNSKSVPALGLQAGASTAVPTVASASSSGWIGVLALLFAAVSAWFFSGELSSVRDRELALRDSLDGELRSVSEDLDHMSLRARERDDEVESRLRAGFDKRQGELEASVVALREEMRTARDHQQKIDVELTRLSEDQRDGDVEIARRIDDLRALALKSRQTVDGLATRLDKTEVALASKPSSAPIQVLPPSGPKYAAELADLTSSTAGTRWNAVQSLGETGDADVVPHVLPLLKDPDVFVRMAVARVCGDLASPLAVESLIDALEDEEPVVREAAMAALHIITGRDFRFDPNAKPVDRAKRVKAWREWWSKAKDEFFGDL